MKKCPKCGMIYDDSWKICLACGLGLSDNTSIKETHPENRIQREEKPPSKFLNFPILLICAVVFFVVAAFVWDITVGGERYYDRIARTEFLQNIGQESKADILQFIRDGEEYILNHPRDKENRNLLEMVKEKSKQVLQKKP